MKDWAATALPVGVVQGPTDVKTGSPTLRWTNHTGGERVAAVAGVPSAGAGVPSAGAGAGVASTAGAGAGVASAGADAPSGASVAWAAGGVDSANDAPAVRASGTTKQRNRIAPIEHTAVRLPLMPIRPGAIPSLFAR
ncbi:MAG: hypothetical protein AMXMBFR34_29050 [Myxococcaceae bacterium]